MVLKSTFLRITLLISLVKKILFDLQGKIIIHNLLSEANIRIKILNKEHIFINLLL